MATLASLTVRLGIDTGPLRAGAERAKRTLTGLGKAVGAVGVGVPAIAGAVTAVGGLAAAFASAGVAVKAFKLAAQPQLQAVSEVAALAAEAQEAAASKAKDAAEKQKAYTDALNKLPPATRATAQEFIGLQGDFKKWSDGLSTSTMPVFTKGIQLLRSLLPALTPLVKAASRAFSDFLDGLKSDRGGIAGFFKTLAGSAEKNLGSLLRSMKNVGVGVAGIIRAFMGVSGDMSGGIEKATAAFARFGQSLAGSAGFARFIDLARQSARTLGTLGTAAIQLLAALSPLIGITSQLALATAKLINAIPPPVLNAIATSVGAVVIGMKLWSAYGAIVAKATRVWAVAQAVLNSAFLASPITWIVLAVVALIAAIVLIATKTQWFQIAWSVAWSAIKSATTAAVAGIMVALDWFKSLGPLFTGWFNAAKDAVVGAFTATINWIRGVPGQIWGALSSLPGTLWSIAVSAGVRFVTGIQNKINSAISTIRGLPGRVKSALGNLGNLLWNAGKSLISGFINGIKSMFGAVKGALGGLTSYIPDWKGPATLDKRLLTPNGQMVMDGFMRGIQNSVPALRRQLGDVTGDLSNMAVGVTPNGVFRTANRAETRIVFDTTGADDDMKRLIRRIVKNDGRGNVQTAFGNR